MRFVRWVIRYLRFAYWPWEQNSSQNTNVTVMMTTFNDITHFIYVHLTWNASVSRFEVALEIVVAWSPEIEGCIRDTDDARLPPGTALVRMLDDVSRATDVSKTLSDTLSELHPTVTSGFHENDLTWLQALSHKVLVMTIVFAFCDKKKQEGIELDRLLLGRGHRRSVYFCLWH